MLQPGGKNWIEKYLFLLKQGEIEVDVEIPEGLSKSEYIHTTLFETGIVFGIPSHPLFVPPEFQQQWTSNERLQVLLFESLLFVYVVEREKLPDQQMVPLLLQFYAQYKERNSLNVLKLVFHETESMQLEKMLSRRVHIRRTMKNQLWVNYMQSSLVYIDVMAFRDYLLHDRMLKESYEQYVLTTLQTVGAASLADGVINSSEQTLLNVFVSSANINRDKLRTFNQQLKHHELTVDNIQLLEKADKLFKNYLIDLAVLTVHSDLTALSAEIVFLDALCDRLELGTEQLQNTIMLIERFVIANNHQVTFLKEQSSYEQLYSNFSKRWIKVLGRNKDRFVEELRESGELLALVNKSRNTELTREEKEKVKSQFKDIAKSMPAVALFMLPGGTLILPIILRIIPDLVPSAFQGNKIDPGPKQPSKKRKGKT